MILTDAIKSVRKFGEVLALLKITGFSKINLDAYRDLAQAALVGAANEDRIPEFLNELRRWAAMDPFYEENNR